jgi:hypothetical protein
MTCSAWTVSDQREIVGTAASLKEAARGCLNDMGRTLTIHDPIGRVRAMYRDGRELDEES